ncbi:hypothetical protein ACE1CI_34220 [Aerosakkonemataceae cyanobacterium BLCC-F50]|uniref:Uncharacterized protein n=1 Tax=Floridaenema flaviceps BLCC-F50 TaxID=3153642 RepID=A0ABV4Y1Y0_9CYAN
MHIEYFKSDRKTRIFSEYDELNETISLNSLSLEITLADISDKVEFEVIETSEN